MTKKKIRKILEKGRIDEDIYFQKQVKNNLKTENFEKNSIDILILEILTKLTGNYVDNEKYIKTMPAEYRHQYIQDLGILFNIRNNL